MKNTLILATVAAAGCLSMSVGAADMGQPMMMSPDQMKWSDVPSEPGVKTMMLEGATKQAGPITFRMKYPANYQIPPHWHPAIEHVTVISGTYHMGSGDKFDMAKTTPLSAGGFAIMHPKTKYFAWVKEDTVIQIHGMGPWSVEHVEAMDAPKKKKQAIWIDEGKIIPY